MQIGYPDGLHLESDAPMGLVNVEDVVVRRILEMAQSLVHQGVGFIGCQRCIHRRVKEYLVAQVRWGGGGFACAFHIGWFSNI